MIQYFILGCPCGNHIRVNTEESRKEIRCSQCGKYIKVPPSLGKIDMRTQTLSGSAQDGIVGKILAKRYKILSYLADGAMGRVYRGTDLLLNLSVAIKILKPIYPISQQQEKRFIHEAHIASELVHPGIVMVRNLHRSRRGGYFMVMDLCPGKSLKTILQTRHHLSMDESLEIARQILLALKVAHDKGVVHRDIKPGNIMVEEKENALKVRILDFGIAKVFSKQGGLELQSLTKTGFIIGTTHYMSPEQIIKSSLSPATDIYGVGALLYHLLTGFPPFQGSREKVLRSIVKKNPESIRKVYKKQKYTQHIPLLLDAIILKAMAKDSKHRFSDAQDFIHAIDLCKKQKNIFHFQAFSWIAQSYWGSLDKAIRRLIFFSLFLLALLPVSLYVSKTLKSNSLETKPIETRQTFLKEIVKKFSQEDYNISSIEKLIEEKKYLEAWNWIQEQKKGNQKFFLIYEEREEWLKKMLDR
ncbi:MAG: serine/threonine protein kinase [Candidatus Brocadiae bacterium]|nr:serine/threonine protein kinase [Candidatus Brocadiia bacterium]